MTFRDNAPGQLDSRGSTMDPTRNDGFMQDATLSEFFQRPIKIAETEWSIATPLFLRFNPWQLFWEDPRNMEKIKNYHLLKCTMHVKLLINGNAFYYGRAILGYEPLADADNTSATSKRKQAYVNADLVRLSQRMHIYVNPTESTGGSLDLPFFWDKNALSITQNEWRYMGDCVLMSINDLQHANGGTEPLTISVLAWAENVSYAIPTSFVPADPEMADEHEQAVISRPASTVARYASALTNIPYIGPFAKATEIGAGAIAAVAKIFGYSSPVNLEYGNMVPMPRTSLAVVDTKYPTNKLSVDSKQEVTIDPLTTGIASTDELPIASIAGRESYLTTFPWEITDAPEHPLFHCRVDPMLYRTNGREYHFPACAAAAFPFEYWRGTMRFRFQIVSSSYHKGRIRIVYDPRGTPSQLGAAYNTHYTTVHDISNEKDFTVDIGWAQNTPFRVPNTIGNTPFNNGTNALLPSNSVGNGTISVYVLNSLSVPGTVVSDIQVNVFVSFLDDFEVAVPSSRLTDYHFRDSVPATLMNTPEMAEEPMEDADCCDTPVMDPQTIDTMADALIDSPDTTKLFFGEVIGSFRQLIKRTCLAEIVRLPEDTESVHFTLDRLAFPEFGGLYDGPTLANSVALTYSNGQKVIPYATTYLNYVSRMFVGWRGSVRWTLDASTSNVSGGGDEFNSLTYVINRTSRISRVTNSTPLVPATGPEINLIPDLLDKTADYSTRGAHLLNTNVNPIQSVEVPFYSNFRFIPTQFEYPLDEFISYMPGFRVSGIIPGSASDTDLSLLHLYCSAGEDMNFFFFNGLQPMYYYPALPSDPGP